MSEPEKLCRTTVYKTDGSWDSVHACGRRALRGSDFCGVHDPERRAAREKARGPTKFERKRMVRDQLEKWMDDNLTPEQVRIITRGIKWGWCEWISPPVDTDITSQEVKP